MHDQLLEDTKENQRDSVHFCLVYYIHKMVSRYKRQRRIHFPLRNGCGCYRLWGLELYI
jgi:hypothetical protein